MHLFPELLQIDTALVIETLDTVNESSASSLPEERVEAGKVLKVADMPDDERPREKALKRR